jgi:hypothetical protein
VFFVLNFLRWFALGWAWSDGNLVDSPMDLLSVLSFFAVVYVFFYTFRRPRLLDKLSGKKRFLYLWFPTIAMVLSFLYNVKFDDVVGTRIFVVLPYAMLVLFDVLKGVILRTKRV